MVEALSAVEGLLILGFVFGIVEVFTTAHHIDALVLAWPWEIAQPLVLLVIGDEVCMGNNVQFLG